jgi:hypothetical protein
MFLLKNSDNNRENVPEVLYLTDISQLFNCILMLWWFLICMNLPEIPFTNGTNTEPRGLFHFFRTFSHGIHKNEIDKPLETPPKRKTVSYVITFTWQILTFLAHGSDSAV